MSFEVLRVVSLQLNTLFHSGVLDHFPPEGCGDPANPPWLFDASVLPQPEPPEPPCAPLEEPPAATTAVTSTTGGESPNTSMQVDGSGGTGAYPMELQ